MVVNSINAEYNNKSNPTKIIKPSMLSYILQYIQYFINL